MRVVSAVLVSTFATVLALPALASPALVFLGGPDDSSRAVWAAHGDRDVDEAAQGRFDAHLVARGERVRACMQQLLETQPGREQVEVTFILRRERTGRAAIANLFPSRATSTAACLGQALGGALAAAPGFVGYRLIYAAAVDELVRADKAPRPGVAGAATGPVTGGTVGGSGKVGPLGIGTGRGLVRVKGGRH